ncbi:MAG: hypothetical protein ACOCTS_00090 [Thermodesulfobacteriota bacterium]
MNLSNSALMGFNTEAVAADGKLTGSGKKAGPALTAGSEKNAENFRRALAHASHRGQTRQAPKQTTDQKAHPTAQEGKSAQTGKQKDNAQPSAAETIGRCKAEAASASEAGGGSPVPAEPGSESELSAINGLLRLLASLDADGGSLDRAASEKVLAGWLEDLKEQSGDARLATELQQFIAWINGGEQAPEAIFGLPGGRSKEGPAGGILTQGSAQAGKSALLAQLQQILAADSSGADRNASRTEPASADSGRIVQDLLEQLRQRLMKDGAQNSPSRERAKTAVDTDQDLKEQLRQIFESREKALVQARQGAAPAAVEAEKTVGRDLQAQLKQLFQQAEAGTAREGQGKDAQAAASLANATGGRRTAETEGRSTLRQLLNDLADKAAAEEKGSGSGKAKEALADLKAGLKNTDAGKGEVEQLLKGLNAEKTGSKPSAVT